MCKLSTTMKKKHHFFGPKKVTGFKEIPTALDPQIEAICFRRSWPKIRCFHCQVYPFLGASYLNSGRGKGSMNKPKLSLLNDRLTNSMERTPVLKYVPYFLLFHENQILLKDLPTIHRRRPQRSKTTLPAIWASRAPAVTFFWCRHTSDFLRRMLWNGSDSR